MYNNYIGGMIMKINLNLQSNYSLNSKGTVEDVLKEFSDFDIISIADHNSVKSCYEIPVEYRAKYINGLEADATVEGYTFDYLCYGFDLNNVDNWVSKTFMTISQRQQKIFDKLVELCRNRNIELDMSAEYDPEQEYAHDAILRMLPSEFKFQNQLAGSDDFYRKGTMDKNFPLYVDMSFLWPSLNELIDIIHSNGGLVFLAHPKRYKFDYKKALDLNKNIVDGIEISNNPESPEEVEELYRYAMSNNLKVTYGTNYNGMKHKEKKAMYIKPQYEESILSWTNNYLILDYER